MSRPAPPSTPPDPAPEAEAPFLARWSARKQAAREAEAAPAEPSPPPAAPPDPAPPPAETPAEPPAQAAAEPLPPGDEDMPPLESLGAGSDLSPFFSPRVSAALRRAALRHLFRQPQFNVRDPLDDYAGDYRSYLPLGETLTADMRHQMERLASTLRERLDTAAAADLPARERGAPAPARPPDAAAGADTPPPEAPENAENAENAEKPKPDDRRD